MHSGPTVNDIIPKLVHVRDLTLTDANSGYHNLKLDERSSYLITFASQLGGFRYVRLPFGVTQVSDMFQRKIDQIVKYLSNVFCIANNILVIGYDNDGNDHERLSQEVPQICRKDSLTLNKQKCHFRCTRIPFFS